MPLRGANTKELNKAGLGQTCQLILDVAKEVFDTE